VKIELAARAGYLLAIFLFLLSFLHIYWALGGPLGLQWARGEGEVSPLRPFSRIWTVAAAFFVAGAGVLGRVSVWGSWLPYQFFYWGVWLLALVLAGYSLFAFVRWKEFLFAPLGAFVALWTAIVARYAPPFKGEDADQKRL